ncbi:hypothetical protein N7472_010570, partial [Penicillium cf. griseofulvum]
EDSLVVTHPTTNSPACGLSTAERTGSPVFHTLWSYVLDITLWRIIECIKLVVWAGQNRDLHRLTWVWKTGLPVRSAVLKPHAGELVVGWVTTSESSLLYVFFVENIFRYSYL